MNFISFLTRDICLNCHVSKHIPLRNKSEICIQSLKLTHISRVLWRSAANKIGGENSPDIQDGPFRMVLHGTGLFPC